MDGHCFPNLWSRKFEWQLACVSRYSSCTNTEIAGKSCIVIMFIKCWGQEIMEDIWNAISTPIRVHESLQTALQWDCTNLCRLPSNETAWISADCPPMRLHESLQTALQWDCMNLCRLLSNETAWISADCPPMRLHESLQTALQWDCMNLCRLQSHVIRLDFGGVQSPTFLSKD